MLKLIYSCSVEILELNFKSKTSSIFRPPVRVFGNSMW